MGERIVNAGETRVDAQETRDDEARMRTWRRWLLVVAGAVAVVLVGSFALFGGSGSGALDARGARAALDEDVAQENAARGDTATGSDDSAPAEPAPELTPAPKGTVPPAVDESGDPVRVAGPRAEVPEDGILDSAEPVPGALPTVPSRPVLVVPDDIPESAAVEGRLVDGFPSDIVAVPEHSEIATSSVARDGDRVQIALEGTSDESAEAVLAFFRTHLAGLGFVESSSPAHPGSTAAAFTRDGHGVVATVASGERGSTFSLAGVLVVTG